MSKTMTTKKNGKVIKHLLLNKKTDNCPLCDAPLENLTGTWNMFHGEISSICCGAPYQIKDYYVDPKISEGYDEFFKELNKPEYIEFSVDEKWIKPIRKAFLEVGVKNINNKEVVELAKKYLGESHS